MDVIPLWDRKKGGRAGGHHSEVWRRGSESNRRPRLCRPLHNHSATPPGAEAADLAIAAQTKRGTMPGYGLSRAVPRNLERETSLELATSTLARLRSTN